MKRQIFKNPELGPGEILKYLLLAAAIVAGVLVCAFHSSCQLTSQGIQALGAEESPNLLAATVLDSKTIRVDFSKEVAAQTGLVSVLGQGQAASLDAIGQNSIKAEAMPCQDAKSILYVFEKSADLGVRYQLFGQIKDARGNSLTFAIPFDGYNDRIPLCALVEVQPENKTSSADKAALAESPYIIIQALQDGNLFGVELHCAQNNLVYPLPAVEARAGEKIVLHLKPTAYPDFCQNELGSNLALAKSARSSPSWRDLFFDIGSKCISATNDAIFLRDRNTGRIMDALTFYTVKSGKTTWNLAEAVKEAVDKKAWLGPASVEGAVQKGSSKVKPLVRTSLPKANGRSPASKDDWKIADKSVY